MQRAEKNILNLEMEKFIKKIGSGIIFIQRAKWDGKNKWWTIPFSEQFLSEIKKVVSDLGLEMLYEEEPMKREGVAKVSPTEVPNYRKCPDQYVNKLEERRYSPNTIRTFCALFEEFLNHFPEKEIHEFGENEVMQFSL